MTAQPPVTPLPRAGILAIDKAAGWTSHDVAAAMRGVLGTRRVGHGGTLDPFATGLLPILYGTATRLADNLHRAPKAYLGEIFLGRETTTDDAEGETTLEADVPLIEDSVVRATLRTFLGAQEQIPPAYSAVRVRGERAYARARRGEALNDLAPRRVVIHDLLLIERGEQCLHVLVTCSSGTYVRALARDVGRALGTRAHLGALRRIAAGWLFVDDAVSVEEARALAEAGALGSLVYAADNAALDLEGLILAEEAARRLIAGQAVHARRASGVVRAYDTRGAFLGIAEVSEGAARPHTIFRREGEPEHGGPGR